MKYCLSVTMIKLEKGKIDNQIIENITNILINKSIKPKNSIEGFISCPYT